jgi:superfamily II DNA or RNA helicase
LLRERYKLPSDATGIDGLYETHDGSHVAYQVKYRQKQQLTFAEVAPFLAITEQFSDRVIFTNAERLSGKAATRTRWVSAEVFRAMSLDALRSIEAWLKAKPLPIVRLTPDPSYQSQALADIKGALSKHHSATVVMACGTGKTLVALWAAEQETPKTVLVLVPSLTLLQQTLREWSEQTNWGSSFSYVCVCSDPTVGLKDDAINPDKSEFEFRIDTDPAIVRRFLERQTTDIKVVFSTYQSSPVVGEGARGLSPFDIAIFDEAHKTIGLAGSAFGYALSDENIRIRKRLFLTATPRHIDIRHRDKEGEFRVYSMDDEAVYGPRAHTLSFRAAAQKGTICRYKVIISLIDKEMVDDFTRRRGITLVEHDEVSARWMANLIAVQQAIEKVNATKIITFHSRVRLAQEFATNQPRGIAYHLRDYDVRHVNGEQSSGERADIIRSFADTQKALLTNARCLTEGVNIPAVDMVAFIDPRQSRVDITQAVGRAMRKPRGQTTKTFGYVVVPVFSGMGEQDSLEGAIKSERFDAVVDVLNALQEHDEEVVDIIREIRERKGAGEVFNPRRLAEKIEVIGPRVDLDLLKASIGVEIADKIGSTWDEWFGLLLRFNAREGHCKVPRPHIEGGFKLGGWVGNQRVNKDKIPFERRQRLDAIGFAWDARESEWEEGFGALRTFQVREGHCNVPAAHREGMLRLGRWVNHLRVIGDTISAERKQRLHAIGFVWDVRHSQWEEGFTALSQFKAREGHCLCSGNHVEGTFKLGGWVDRQRARSDKMLTERRQRLDSIGFIWDVRESEWKQGFAALTQFKAREGHCRVPKLHMEETFKLGQWVNNLRGNKDKLPSERKRGLEVMGMDWNARESRWEEGFAALTKFTAREGHCRVPLKHSEGAFNLAKWVRKQRAIQNTISSERKQRLDAIEVIWGVLDSGWEEGFAALNKFKAREGHCRVPARHMEGKFNLGQWVTVRRRDKDTLPVERRNRLDATGFVWEARESGWEEGFAALTVFKAREGHCGVPKLHIEGIFKLGQWVSGQRHRRDTSAERRQRLEAIGLVWDVLDSGWEEGFAALKTFKAREGHCSVPKLHIEATFKLGQWVSVQRTRGANVSAERRKRLDAIGFVWDSLESAWDEGFAALKKFQVREGHCRVPALHVEGKFKLGGWVRSQIRARDSMSSERKQRLDAIGLVWAHLESTWEDGFTALTEFKTREGHCRVPQRHVEGTFKLGQWAKTQRTERDTMSAERRQRLDAIGFVWRTK